MSRQRHGSQRVCETHRTHNTSLTGALLALTVNITIIEEITSLMPLIPRLRTLFAVVAVTGPLIAFAEWQIRKLEIAYPPLPLETNSTAALRNPTSPGTHTRQIDIYGARVPVSSLLAKAKSNRQLAGASPEELWARAFFNSKTLELEARLFGRGTVAAGQLGEEGFEPGASLLSGAMRVIRAPVVGSPLLIEWHMPDFAIRFFEYTARWGSPWRLMEGGRQEWSVGSDLNVDGEVEIRYGSAQDWKVVDGEGGGGKVVPKLFWRLHCAYARYLLDQAVHRVQSQEANSNGPPSNL